ncbi:MAG: M28 family peptidase [Bacteroidales bacterium]|nr:M28 family peptidase [Bacteroidales bacterium]MCF8344988.1 M28 family peptidase [Bacteroidales bacterium]MCF8350455.1 M28 family peptidase [Bacteroidales bacterium]MCF8376204.1 M28 family peptidase [Bacteroidales bacterium]MCF8401130.1 M28 family peptidase [Bacteroidales bacterium]
MKKIFSARTGFGLVMIFFVLSISAQDIDYAEKMIKKLSSKKFAGRGYVKDGDLKAAKFIADEFAENGLKSFDGKYFQRFGFPVNTFPYKIKLKIDGEKLMPFDDFIVYANSSAAVGEFELLRLQIDSADQRLLKRFYEESELNGKVLVADRAFKKLILDSVPENLAGIIFTTDKNMYWFLSIAQWPVDYFTLEIDSTKLPEEATSIKIDLRNLYLPAHKTQNVVGWIKGKSKPDSFLVFTAHYDHLGYMGKRTWFPGANDNASGVAMITDLGRHFALEKNKPDYSMLFIASAGEETGLMGATYFALNPLIPLDQMKFLINLDMVGTGSEGITVVNGEVFEEEFERLVGINNEYDYLQSIKARGESCNSDHCPFYKEGVPSFFIYTRGKEFSEYHNPDDAAKELPLTDYEDLFRLLAEFVQTY